MNTYKMTVTRRSSLVPRSRKFFIKRTSWATVFLLATITTFVCAQDFERFRFKSGKTGDVVAGQILVKLKSPQVQAQWDQDLQKMGCSPLKTLKRLNVQVIQLPPGRSVQDAIKEIQSLPHVERVSPNVIFRRTGVQPSDPLFSQQNALQMISASSGWSLEKGASNPVVVAVVDSGVDLDHPDLVSKLFTNPGEIAGDGLDNDLNGVIDDVHGADFKPSALGNPLPDGDPDDPEGHGTLVSGIVGAATNNGVGMAGVSWEAKILAVKVFPPGENSNTDAATVAQGVDYAMDIHTRYPQFGRMVINLSLGSDNASSDPEVSILDDALDMALDQGIVIVASSGNIEVPSEYQVLYPANKSGVIAVGATNASDDRAFFSSYGPELDVMAPGVSVLSATIGGTYEADSGTSFSAPVVSGLAALLLSAKPLLVVTQNANQVEDLLRQSADDVGAAGFDTQNGYGRVNVFRALTLATQGSFSQFQGETRAIAFPNPFRPNSSNTVTFAVPSSLQGSNVKITIHTQGGDLVRSLSTYTWDGRNEAGTMVASGVYFWRLQTDRGNVKGRLAVVK